MARIVCEDCDSCAIRGECDDIEKMVKYNRYSVLLATYEYGKAEGRKEAIDEFARALIIDGEVSTAKAIRIAKRLKEQKE